VVQCVEVMLALPRALSMNTHFWEAKRTISAPLRPLHGLIILRRRCAGVGIQRGRATFGPNPCIIPLIERLSVAKTAPSAAGRLSAPQIIPALRSGALRQFHARYTSQRVSVYWSYREE
jgi:hypothetical protein